MIKRIGGYRTALILASAVAVTEMAMVLYLAANLNRSDGAAIRVGVALLIVFGLWIQSNVARYLGALWLVISAAAVIWSAVSDRPAAGFGPVLVLTLCALSLVTAYVLVASTQFAVEFARLRKTRPAYKTFLGRAVLIAFIAAAVIATAYDVYRFTR